MGFDPDSLVLDGRFRIIRSLGKGGMGEVYLAEQVSLQRKVAIKVLKPQLTAEPLMLERFRREARLLSQVDHPAVVRVIDFGSEQHAACLVMELVEGTPLRDALSKDGPMPPARAIPLMAQLAEGLTAIHEKGIIHRDLKPENVVITKSARGEQARLLDFGIAKLAEPDASLGAVTQVGLVLGTPEYLSPEQAMGQPLDSRSDLYSFGVLAFQLLANALPFDGPSPRQFMAQHVTMPPRRLEEANPALLAHPELCALIMRCLVKDAAQRVQRADELVSALEQLRARAMLLPAGEAPAAGGGTALFGAVAGAAAGSGTKAASSPRASAGEAWRRAVTMARWRWAALGRRWRLAAIGAAALGVVGAAVLALGSDSTAALARAAVSEGRAKEALTLIELAEREQKGTPALKQLKAVALHRVDRHRDDIAVLHGMSEASLESTEPLVYALLASHFATHPRDRQLHEVIKRLPRDELEDHFESLLDGPADSAHWGALRYLDLQQKSLDGALRVSGYVKALQNPDCAIREDAIERLEKIGDESAVAPLEAIAPPKSGGFGIFADDCGKARGRQAAASIKKRLKR